MHPKPSPWLCCSLTKVANAFNSLLREVVFQELHVIGGDIIQPIPFVCAFYALKSPLFYSHYNCESDVIVIPFAMEIRQGDFLGGTLFVLAHFTALHSTISHFPSFLFPSIVDDTHIIGPPSIVSFVYEHFQTKLRAIGLSIQLHKCITWSPVGLSLDFNTPS
jgi:hypothetical protein